MVSRLIRIAAVFCLTVLAATPLRAQDTQVPLDEGGRVQTANLALARQLGLWVDEYPGFQEARLFRSADSSFVLEITSSLQGQTSRQRIPLSAQEVATLRRTVSSRLAQRAPMTGTDQRGRYLLLGQTTAAGALFYGWAVPYVLKTNDAASAGLYLVTTSASFFLPFVLTQNQPVSYGMANLSRYGITRGAAHGLLLHNLLLQTGSKQICEFDVCYEEGGDHDRNRAALAMLGSVAEGVGGYLWARGEEMNAGTASSIELGGDLGLLWGLGTAYLLGTDDIGERTTAAVALPAAAAGLVLGHRLAARRDFVWGDVDVLYTAAALGAFVGGSAIALVDEDAERPIVTAAMLGGAAGVYVADRLVKDTDFTVGQSTLNRLGTLAGGLAGASLGVMAQDGKVALAGGAVGGVLGFAVTYRMLAPAARNQRGEELSSLKVHFTPSSLLAAAMTTDRDRGAPALPLLGVEYRFGAK
jgi:hypothetical protein